MKLFLLTLCAGTALASSAFAARYDLPSTVDSVTVYTSGADVTRLVPFDLPAGSHDIVLGDLPEGIDPASLRVTGQGDGALRIVSVDIGNDLVDDGNRDSARAALEAEIAALRLARQTLDQQIADIATQRDVTRSLANGVLSGDTTVSPVDLGPVLAMTREQLGALTALEADLRRQTVEMDKRIEALFERMAELAPDPKRQTVVVVNALADEPVSGVLNVRYGVAQAGWRAAYDANLVLDAGFADASLEVSRRAEIIQTSGEDWTDVSVRLSTARPRLATSAPQMSTWIVDAVRPEPMPRVGKSNQRTEFMLQSDAMAEVAPAPAPVVVQDVMAVMETGGFSTSFTVPGRVSIASVDDVKSVALDTLSLSPKLSVETVPSIDPTAYLVADVRLEGGSVWLPGEVRLSRNGAHVGIGHLPLLTPGAEHRLGFGVDDLVVVEHAQRDREKGTKGLLTTSNVDERNFITRIRNGHDFAISVRVIDRLPVSQNEAVRVALTQGTTAIDITDLDDRAGVVAWDLNLAAGAEAQIDFGYRVEWPEGMIVSALP